MLMNLSLLLTYITYQNYLMNINMSFLLLQNDFLLDYYKNYFNYIYIIKYYHIDIY